MKYIVISLFVALFGLQQTEAQIQQEQISFGEVKYDGFYNITKGAHWSDRPEAKEVYYGKIPSGVTAVYEIDQDYLARFATIKGEHNNLDRNYIIFPKGQRVYKKNDTVYAAICGNKLEYFKPLVQIKFVNSPTQPKDSVAVNIIRKDSVITTITRKDSVITEIKQPDGPIAPKDDAVVGNVTINNTYTTNIYGAQQGGPQRVSYSVYQERRGGFRIFLGYRGGGGNISNPVQVINPRYDPGGLGGTPPTRWDPPGNGGRIRQVFDPAGIN